jgi:hypothetical protein
VGAIFMLRLNGLIPHCLIAIVAIASSFCTDDLVSDTDFIERNHRLDKCAVLCRALIGSSSISYFSELVMCSPIYNSVRQCA